MVLGGYLQKAIGVKLTCLIGCLLISLSTLSAYWTVNSFPLFCLTYGLLFGFGNGITFSAPMTAGLYVYF